MNRLCPYPASALLLSALLLALPACQNESGSAERAGKKIDSALAEAGKKTDEALTLAGRKVDDAVDKAGQQIEKAGASLQETTQSDKK